MRDVEQAQDEAVRYNMQDVFYIISHSKLRHVTSTNSEQVNCANIAFGTAR